MRIPPFLFIKILVAASALWFFVYGEYSPPFLIRAHCDEVGNPNATLFALLVGDSGLATAEQDVRQMDELLISQGYSTKALCGSNANACRINQWLTCFDSLARKQDLIFFYYSGHAIPYHSGLLLALSTHCDAYPHGLSLDTIIHKINISRATQRIIIIDACYGLKADSLSFNSQIPFHSLLSNRFSFVCGGLAQIRQGQFTAVLLDALRGAADDPVNGKFIGGIEAVELESYLRKYFGPITVHATGKEKIILTNIMKDRKCYSRTEPGSCGSY